ncbi:MAG: sodium:proton antiporter [Actinomycetota bacterium]|nr:sodium:proton antiporter [Actinomycetota bacterium]
METDPAVGLAAIVVLGVGAQWLAARLRLPSILVLLLAGVTAGPVTGLVEPDDLFGELLFPLVSLAVGILLFEGGLSLRLRDIDVAGVAVGRMVTIGVAITWGIGAVAAMQLFDMSTGVALLLGAILTVSGPTVVIPLLRQSRPREPVGSILRWEGIVIDPIGAALAVVVFHALVEHETDIGETAVSLGTTAFVGTGVGLLAAVLLIAGLRTFRIPDHLQNPVALLFAVGAFALANGMAEEAGLFATTVLGIAVANQRYAPVSHIAEFQEELGPLILAGLFVVLAARVEFDALSEVAVPSILFALVLVFVARPIVVAVSTWGTGLSIRERAFLVAIAPRGTVAASVASLFALDLGSDYEGADLLAPVVFCVIVATVVWSGLSAVPLAQWLGVARERANGVALVGAHPWSLKAAHALSDAGVRVLLVAPEGLPDEHEADVRVDVFHGKIGSEEFLDRVTEDGIGQAVICTRSPELNTLALTKLNEVLKRQNIFHLPPEAEWGIHGVGADHAVWGRRPFGEVASLGGIEKFLAEGAQFRSWTIGEDEEVPYGMIVMFTVDTRGRARVHKEEAPEPATGTRVIGLVPADVSDQIVDDETGTDDAGADQGGGDEAVDLTDRAQTTVPATGEGSGSDDGDDDVETAANGSSSPSPAPS